MKLSETGAAGKSGNGSVSFFILKTVANQTVLLAVFVFITSIYIRYGWLRFEIDKSVKICPLILSRYHESDCGPANTYKACPSQSSGFSSRSRRHQVRMDFRQRCRVCLR